MRTLGYPDIEDHIEVHNRFHEELEAMLDIDPSIHAALQACFSISFAGG
ncbi:MAG: hypothetical protein GY697_26770 [Desulfobacterales bacterium]|nr:hypothetical protein [Desulfobacterales bacterium]